MSAANPKPQEPSMEEILASIRRIIADDQEVAKAPAPAPAPAAPKPAPAAAPPPAAPSAAPPPSPAPLEDVLELSEVARPVKLANRSFAPEEPPPEIDFREVAEASLDIEPMEFAPPPRSSEPQPAASGAFEQPDELLSHSTHAAVGQAFNMLAHTVLSSNARTLEDLVREMLRPMLKNWLDDNLPTVVERLVRAEIERVARGGR